MTRQVFRAIADDLRLKILSGELAPGAYLPTHDELVKQYGKPRATVRRAIEELTREGYLIARQPQGVIVRDTTRHRLEVGAGFEPPFPNLASRLVNALANGRRLHRTIQVGFAEPPPGVAQRLGTGRSPVVIRHQVIHAGGHHISIDNTYLLDLSAELRRPDLDLDTAAALERVGHSLAWEKEELLGRLATPDESREMWWSAGSPVFVEMRTGRTASGLPVRCRVHVLPGDTWIIEEDHSYPAARCIQAVI